MFRRRSDEISFSFALDQSVKRARISGLEHQLLCHIALSIIENRFLTSGSFNAGLVMHAQDISVVPRTGTE